jgi:hypothetical protein
MRPEAEKAGPFAGGDEGPGLDTPEAGEKIDVPREEKIMVRDLGAEDPRRYSNKPGARARTELGSDEFKKTENDRARSEQSIPLEYRGVLE